jgi:diacylglycerol kinase family enzyme
VETRQGREAATLAVKTLALIRGHAGQPPWSGHFLHYVGGILVPPQALESGVAQPPAGGPFGEADLGDEPGFHPVHPGPGQVTDGFEGRIRPFKGGQDLAGALRLAAASARILGVVGGDGMVSAAAAVAVEAGLPLLVIPADTFNHIAADLGVEGARDALAALRDGQAVQADLAMAGGRPFVNTSSTGLYADLVNGRRQLEGVLGKRLAEVVALIGVLRRGRPHELILDGKRRRLWLYFAGNCRYEPQGMAPAYRPDLADGWLDIRIVEAAVLARSRLVAAVLTGTLGRSRVYRSWRTSSVDVRAVNSALFIVVVLELVRTIMARLEGGGFQLQPFLVIGIISATRDILTVGAELSLVG